MSLPILYVKSGCPWCSDALQYFEAKSVKLDIVDVRTNPNRMDELVQVSGQSKTPTLKNEDFIVADFDISEFEEALQKNPEEAKKLGL
ncbi:MAG: glutaredoxin family protein [Verrucomicrobiota bacterium]|nr:glutaredoxin family protein [Verrucomicrobiota bacterium]